MSDVIAYYMNGAIGAARQRIFDDALRTLRPHRADDNFAACLLLDAQSFFKRIAIRLVYFKREIGFFDPRRVFVDSQDRVLVRDLLHEN